MNARTEAGWRDQSRYYSQHTTLLNRLSLIGVIGGAALLAYVYLVGGAALGGIGVRGRLRALAPFIGSWLIVLVVCLWRGMGYWRRASAFLLGCYIVGGIIFARQGLSGSGRLWLAILPALVFVLMGPRWGGFAALFSVLIYAALTVLVSLGWSSLSSLAPVGSGHWISGAGDFLILMTALILVVGSLDRGCARTLSEANAARKQLEAGKRKLVTLSEQLRRKSSQLETAAGVARAGTSTLDLNTLLDQVVDQMLNGFDSIGVDRVGCFLLDDSGEAAILQAVASKAGQPRLEKGDRLRLDHRSVVASSIIDEQVQVITGADESAEWGEPAAEQRHWEIVLPLRSGGRTLGAVSLLSVRDVQQLAPDEGDIDHLQAVVDQVAVAVQNAQLSSQAQTALEELEAVQRRYSAEEWTEFLAERTDFRVDYRVPDVEVGDDGFLRETRRLAMEQNRPIVRDSSSVDSHGESDQAEGALVVPLRLRGRLIGTMALHETRRKPAWTDEEVALAETVAQEIARTVENLRLMDESRRRLARERLVGEVTARIRESLDVESVLKTGAVGIREAMGLPAVTVRLTDLDGDERAEGA